MDEEFRGNNRTYQSGRSTEGWERGNHITSLNEMPVGTLMIVISHGFRAENLAIVTETRRHLGTVSAQWANNQGEAIGRNPFSIHAYELQPDQRANQEFFFAVREEINFPVYRQLATGLIQRNAFMRTYLSNLLGNATLDPKLEVYLESDAEVTRDSMNRGAFVTCTIWVDNPDYEEEET